jgi:putative SOS response-associated peptidase YedK
VIAITAADGAPVLAFAGLWDRWRDPATCEEILSCTIIVSGASAWMEPYHDRMCGRPPSVKKIW